MKTVLQQKNDVPFAPAGNWWEFISDVSTLNKSTVKDKISLGHNVCDFLGSEAAQSFPPDLREDLLKPLLALENAYEMHVEYPKGKLERELMKFYEKMFDVAYMAFVASVNETDESSDDRNFGVSAKSKAINCELSTVNRQLPTYE